MIAAAPDGAPPRRMGEKKLAARCAYEALRWGPSYKVRFS